MAFTGTLTKNAGAAGYHTAFADGTAPTPSPGEIAIVGTVAHGEIIYLVAGDGVDFGTDMPDFLMNIDLSAATGPGTNFELVEGGTVNSGYICKTKCRYTNGSFKIPIKAVPSLGRGKGLGIGDLQTTMQISAGGTVGGVPGFSTIPYQYDQIETIVGRKSREVQFTATTVWPAKEQENMMKNSVRNSQGKNIWHYSGVDGHGGLNPVNGKHLLNAYFGLPSGSGGGKLTGCPYTIVNSTTIQITISENVVSKYIDINDYGRTVDLSALSSVGVAGSATITSFSGTTVTLSVVGWPASGSGTLDIQKYGTMYHTRSVRGNNWPYGNTDDYQLTAGGTVSDIYQPDITHQLADPLILQQWASITPEDATIWIRIINPLVGELYNYVEVHSADANFDEGRDTFEICHFPGHNQGNSVNPMPGNPHMDVGVCGYYEDLIQQYGNACYRVEVTDTADNGATTKKLAQFRILSLANKVMACRVYAGNYGSSSMVGEYLHVMTGPTTRLVSKQI